ncbi:MAG: hypothetical protein JOZ08_07660 [Verrucomicrobia bacterium]|nr:hypothetical protein [Verrucomicrobiota bacterium]MBV8275237.1 hypothetical protein [Verrucomicrobiota bacterium]
MSDEIIVGCGASALTHLYYATQTDFGHISKWNITVLGKDDLWGKIAANEPEHRFGQPPQIVSLEGKKPTVDIDRKNPIGFQTATQIHKQLNGVKDTLEKKGVKFFPELVAAAGITEFENRMRVKTQSGRTFYADRVIVATGFGRSALPRCQMPSEIQQALTNGSFYKTEQKTGAGTSLIMGGTEYLWDKNIKPPKPGEEFHVAVQGSSATSSWVVLRAIALNKSRGDNAKLRITWISRSGFGDANPAGRNNDMIQLAYENGWLTIAEVDSISLDDKTNRLSVVLKAPGGADRPAEKLTTLGDAYANYYKHTYASQDPKTRNSRIKDLKNKITNASKDIKEPTLIKGQETIYVDHFIYALGADPMLPGGAGWVLPPAIQQKLQPVIDSEKRFDDDSNATTLGFKTPDGKVWVVGSTAFRGAGIKALEDLGKKYSNISKMMCEAGSPPEGIAAIIAGAKALTGWKENYSGALTNLKKLNVQVADFKEIENWFDAFYKVKTGKQATDAAKRLIADQIVALRKHTVFGLKQEEVEKIGDPNHEFWGEMFKTDDSGRLTIDVIASVPDIKKK